MSQGEGAVAQPSAQDAQSVEELVRRRLSEAFGGRRGILEAIVPTLGFTVTWIVTHWLELSLAIGGAGVLVVVVVRLVQRSSIKYVMNAVVGIAFAAIIALKTGNAEDVFLPGIIYNGVYFVFLSLTALIRWPLVGFLVGSVTGDPVGWHRDKQMVKLCTNLTWLLALPCLLRFAVQYPLWAAGETGWLGVAKLALGWPLQIAAFAAMGYVLARNHTPLEGEELAEQSGQAAQSGQSGQSEESGESGHRARL
jgi:hypothetical protein